MRKGGRCHAIASVGGHWPPTPVGDAPGAIGDKSAIKWPGCVLDGGRQGLMETGQGEGGEEGGSCPGGGGG